MKFELSFVQGSFPNGLVQRPNSNVETTTTRMNWAAIPMLREGRSKMLGGAVHAATAAGAAAMTVATMASVPGIAEAATLPTELPVTHHVRTLAS